MIEAATSGVVNVKTSLNRRAIAAGSPECSSLGYSGAGVQPAGNT
jgi:hypothetical protein